MPDPQVIGKYRIEGRLGQGGMGAVFLARDSRIGRLVALKVLRVDNEEMRKRFELEAQSAGRLKHPNIVTVYDYEEYDGNPCLAMEYVEGHTLSDIIQRAEPLPIAHRLELIEQVCHGLSFAHAAGIVHRDIKPSNLMVDHNGVVKILDFGIARNVDRGLTRSHRMVGTAGYMSPEQVRGDKVDHRCDIFAVGLVLFEVLTGQRAFPGENEYSVFDRILNGSPDAFVHPDARVLDGVGPIIDTALARLPEDRYQAIASLASDLAEVRQRFESEAVTDEAATVLIQSSPTPVTPVARVPSQPPRTPRTPKTGKPKTPVPLPPELLPTQGGTALTRPAASASSAPPSAAQQSSRYGRLAVAAAATIVVAVIGVRYGSPFLNRESPSSASSPGTAAAQSGGAPLSSATPQSPASKQDPGPAPEPPVVQATAPAADPPPTIASEDTKPKADPKPSAPAVTAEAKRAAAQRVAEAQTLFDDGQYDAAIKAYEAAAVLDPTDKKARDGITSARKAKAAEEAILQRMKSKPPL